MVKNLLSLLALRQNSILSGATILMFAVFASKFLGLVKDRLLLHNFTTDQASVFFAAFNLPDLLFNFLIFGTLSVAFIPIFTEHLHQKGEENAFEFASNILNLSLLAFGLVALAAFIFVSPLNSILLPGFEGDKKALTDQMTRLLLVPQLLLVIGSFFVGISQSYQRFIIPSLAPLFYNLGIIFGIAILSPFFGIAGPVIGVIIGSMLHILIQLPLIESLKFKYRFSFNFGDSGVKEVFRLMSIRNIGLIAEQVSDKVGIALASLISPSSVTLLNLSQHLFTAPISLFGLTIAQAAFPVLSREQTKGEHESFKITLLTTLHQILFLTLPAAAILVVLRIPVVRLVFGASQFNWDDTVLTGYTVAYMALGLSAQSVVLLLVRGFYALRDTRTPVGVSLATVAVNIVLSYSSILLTHKVWGLGVAYAVSTNISLALLLYFLHKKVGGFDKRKLLLPALKMLVSAVTAAIALYIPIKALDQLVFDTTRTVNLVMITGIASIFGLAIYLLLVWLMDVQELVTFVNLLKKLANLQNTLKTEEVTQDTANPV